MLKKLGFIFLVISSLFLLFGCTMPQSVAGNGVCEIGESIVNSPNYYPLDCTVESTSIFYNAPASNGDFYSDPRIIYNGIEYVPYPDLETAAKWCSYIEGKNYVGASDFQSYSPPIVNGIKWQNSTPSWILIESYPYTSGYTCTPGETDISEQSARIAWASAQPWAIVDWVREGTTMTLILRNQTAQTLKYNSIYIDGVSQTVEEGIEVSPGQNISVKISGFSFCEENTKYRFSKNTIQIGYSNESILGMNQNGIADIVGTCAREIIECTDSDNGLDYYLKGVGTGMRSEEGPFEVNEDKCVDSNTLVDWSCTENGFLDGFWYICENGCLDGACIPKVEYGFNSKLVPRTSNDSIFVNGGTDYNRKIGRLRLVDILINSEDRLQADFELSFDGKVVEARVIDLNKEISAVFDPENILDPKMTLYSIDKEITEGGEVYFAKVSVEPKVVEGKYKVGDTGCGRGCADVCGTNGNKWCCVGDQNVYCADIHLGCGTTNSWKITEISTKSC